MDIYIPKPILDYYCSVDSVQQLSKNTAKEIVTHANIQYVITGYAASGEAGHLWCWAKQVVPVQIYKGKLKPLQHNMHHVEVQQGKRERGYSAQLFTFEGKQYVTHESETIAFYPTESGVQLDLF